MLSYLLYCISKIFVSFRIFLKYFLSMDSLFHWIQNKFKLNKRNIIPETKQNRFPPIVPFLLSGKEHELIVETGWVWVVLFTICFFFVKVVRLVVVNLFSILFVILVSMTALVTIGLMLLFNFWVITATSVDVLLTSYFLEWDCTQYKRA